MKKTAALHSIPLFSSLNEAELEAIAPRAVEKRFNSGEVLFYEGEPCHGIYLLVQGTVKIFKTSPSGREVLLTVDSAPASVAEVPLFDGGAYPATVSAVDDVTAFFISTKDFRQFCLEHPEVALKVLAVVGQRLRQLVALVEAVTFGNVRQRLARLLLERWRESGTDVFHLAETHQELASRLGTVREVVSRNLSRFHAEGLIQLGRREVRILDAPGMELEAEMEY